MGTGRLGQRIVCAVLTAGLLAGPAGAVETSAASAALIEQSSGRVLYEQNAGQERLIASITKIMTAITALEHGDKTREYTVTAQDMAEGSSMYLKPGDVLRLEELLYGLMLASGNDAALAVAHCVSGSVEAFVDLMNETARHLGLTHTHFVNPNGLDAEGHYSSAGDMAALAAYALQNQDFRRIVSTASITIGDRYLANHNKLLRMCEGCIGVKTGFTKAAGRTLVSAAVRDGMTLVCATLNDGNDWNDHMALLDYGFANYPRAVLAQAGDILAQVPVKGSLLRSLSVAPRETVAYPLQEGESVTVEMDLPEEVQAPVLEGEIAGSLRFFCNSKLVGETYLVWTGTAGKDVTGEGAKPSPLEYLRRLGQGDG